MSSTAAFDCCDISDGYAMWHKNIKKKTEDVYVLSGEKPTHMGNRCFIDKSVFKMKQLNQLFFVVLGEYDLHIFIKFIA